MSIALVTGPVHVYTATRSTFPANTLLTYPSAGNIDYLGTGEIAPDFIKQPKFDPVFNDLGGSLPWDYLFQGEEALIPLTLTVWNQSVANKVAALPLANGTEGSYAANDIGTLMITEGCAYHMWLHFPYYSNKSIFQTAGMLAGYHLWAAWADGPLVYSGGTKANKVRINFKGARLYQGASTGNGWKLYDHTMTYIPATPPTAASGAVT